MTISLTTRKIVIISISFQLALIGLIGFSQFGFNLPVLREIIGFICLILIPGVLLVRILKIGEEVNWLGKMVYAIGLSLSYLMILGLMINMVYPMFGLLRPLDTWPITLTHSIFVIFIAGLLYKRSFIDNFDFREKFNINREHSWPFLYLLFILMLSLAGSLIVTVYHNNHFLLLFIIIISFFPFMACFKKGFPQKLYPLAIYTISLALLFHVTMVSEYPMRLNVDNEFFYQNLVVQNGYWDPNLSHVVNTALSIVILGPIFSKVLGLNIFWLFKVIYPIIFAIVPVVLYMFYKRQTNYKVALFSVLFFMFSFYFYVEAPLLRRQQIALIFLSLIILLITEDKLVYLKKVILGIVFAVSLIVSHYSMGYISLIIFSLTYCLFLAIKKIVTSKLWSLIQRKVKYLDIYTHQGWIKTSFSSFFTLSFIILYIVIALSWYMYIGGGSSFAGVTNLGKYIFMNLSNFLDPYKRSPLIAEALGGDFLTAPLLSKIYRILQYSTQIFIIIGFIWTILQPKSFKLEYIFLSIVSVIFLALSMVVPLISIAINMPRIYFILLVILAPFCIIGASLLWNISTSIVKKYNWVKHKWYKKIAVIFEQKLSSHANNFYLIFNLLILIPYFLFNVGFIFAIRGYSEETRDLAKIPSSASLSYDAVDTGYYTSQEITAALRVSQIIDKNSMIFGDRDQGCDLISSWHESVNYFRADLNIPIDSYVFLRKWNLDHNEIKVEIIKGVKSEYQSISTLKRNVFVDRDKIYTNGAAEILSGSLKTNSGVNVK